MGKKQFVKKNKDGIIEPRINNELRNLSSVRLIYKGSTEEESFSKIMNIEEAFKLSKQYSLDLIEINGKITPPIIRLYDYSKYLYELKKANKQKAKNNTVCKEIQLRTNIGENDLKIKVNKAKEFIKNGDKVKVVLTMRGRELGRRELSKECFNTFIDMISDVAVFESSPRDEGNKVIVIFKKK